jgi:hypothetical protein
LTVQATHTIFQSRRERLAEESGVNPPAPKEQPPGNSQA